MSEEMTEGDGNTQQESSSFFLVMGLIALPLLYVLSVGPAAWLHNHDFFPEAIEVMYTPVVWLRDNTFLKSSLDWYVSFFDGY